MPDFVKLCEAYGWGGELVSDPAQLPAAYQRMLDFDGPYLLDVAISRDQNVFPMVAPGSSLGDVMGAIDSEADGTRIMGTEPVGKAVEAEQATKEGEDR